MCGPAEPAVPRSISRAMSLTRSGGADFGMGALELLGIGSVVAGLVVAGVGFFAKG